MSMPKRSNRHHNNLKASAANKSSLDRIFYMIIGVLSVILLTIVLFIFLSGSDSVKDVSDDLALNQQEVEKANNSKDPDNDASKEQSSKQSVTQRKVQDTPEHQPVQSTNQSENATVINDDPPYDPDHSTDFNDGSDDRLEIRSKVSDVTGIPESDLIERWIGNDGVARIEATVESRSTGAGYIVYLQYGEGEWHVESVQNN